MNVEKIKITNGALEALLLQELRKHPRCGDVESVTVTSLKSTLKNGANWKIEGYEPGDAVTNDVGKILWHEFQTEFQAEYELID
jgi:hypothetical protein